MICICHPGPYHKSACPCQTAYTEARQKAEREDITTPKEATSQARLLVSKGYEQSSRKHRQVSLIVDGHWDDHPITLSYRTFAEFRRMTGGAWGTTRREVLAFRAKSRLQYENR